MSQHKYKTVAGLIVTLGFDRPLNFVFCLIEDPAKRLTSEDSDPYLYSNLQDTCAGTEQQDVEYFRPIIERLAGPVPNTMFKQVALDQAAHVGNRICLHTLSGRFPRHGFVELTASGITIDRVCQLEKFFEEGTL